MRASASRSGWSILVVVVLLAVPAPGRSQDTCDVVVELNDPASPAVIAYGITYDGAGGSFVGTGLTPACTPLFGEWNTLFDDDASLLSGFHASLTAPHPTQPLLSCVFALDGGFPCPAPSAFSVMDPDFPPLGGIEFEDMFPNLSPPTLAINVTPRTPICGDGFREGAETCDDGNLVDGDCCSSACVMDGAGTPCTDGSVCTLNDTCDAAGACVPDASLSCDDGDACTTDTCDPIAGCQSAAVPAPHSQCDWNHTASLDLRDPSQPEKRKLQWQMVSRHRPLPGWIGDPTVDTDYALCVYDEVGGVSGLVGRLDVPAGANWQAINATRFQYKDPTRSVNGVERLRVDGKTKGVKLQLKAARAGLPLPGPAAPDRYFAQDEVLRVQLRNTAGGCWSVGFASAVHNTADRFKAKSK